MGGIFPLQSLFSKAFLIRYGYRTRFLFVSVWYYFVVVIFLPCWVEKIFFSNFTCWPIPKCSTTKCNTLYIIPVIYESYLSILIPIYLLPYLYLICSCFFRGGEGWWDVGGTHQWTYSTITLTFRWSKNASNRTISWCSGVSFGHQDVCIGRISERNTSARKEMLVMSSPFEDLKNEIMISCLQNLNYSYIASPVIGSSLSMKGSGFLNSSY